MKRMLIIIKPDYMQKGQMGKPFNGRAEGIHLWRAMACDSGAKLLYSFYSVPGYMQIKILDTTQPE